MIFKTNIPLFTKNTPPATIFCKYYSTNYASITEAFIKLYDKL